jgi:hypothetical protein
MPRSHTQDREVIPKRAGTHLSAAKVPVMVRGADGRFKQHGSIDTQQRIYQHGGELGNFVRWSKHAITLSSEAWHQMGGLVDRIEMIDHGRNECYSVSSADAHRHASFYADPKLGRRVAVPLDAWDVYDADGQLVRAASL